LASDHSRPPSVATRGESNSAVSRFAFGPARVAATVVIWGEISYVESSVGVETFFSDRDICRDKRAKIRDDQDI